MADIDHKSVERLVSTFVGKVGAPAATLAARALGKPNEVSPTGRIDPLMKPEQAQTAWTKIVNEFSRTLGSNLVYALMNKIKGELGLR
jgi:hypothetical protein